MKEEKKLIALVILSVCVLAIMIYAINNVGIPFKADDKNNIKCSTSKYNIYSNSTSATYVLGRCYIPVYDSYQTHEVCRGGFLGIGQSCYESSKPHTETIRNEVCFKLKTGERC